MINHIRTLLLNAPRTTDTVAGEEYVPSEYRAITVPAVVRKIRSVVFGGSPDRYMLNYRLRQIMTVLHATELDEFVRDADPRLTYLPFDDGLSYMANFGVTASSHTAEDGDFAVVGNAVASDMVGQLYFQWRVAISDATHIRVTSMLTGVSTLLVCTMTDGRSNILTMPDSGMRFTVAGTTGTTWAVTSLAEPSRNLGTVLADLKSMISDVDLISLLGASPTGTKLTLRDLWKKHDKFAYQFGAIMLAAALCTDEARA